MMQRKWIETCYYEGLKKYREGNFNRAMFFFKIIINYGMDEPKLRAHAFNNVGLIFCKQEKRHEALNFFEKAIELNKEEPKYYHNSGVIFSENLNDKKTGAFYFHDAGVLYLSKNKFDKAIEMFKTALELFEDARFYEQLGHCYFLRNKNKNDLISSINCFEKVMKEYTADSSELFDRQKDNLFKAELAMLDYLPFYTLQTKEEFKNSEKSSSAKCAFFQESSTKKRKYNSGLEKQETKKQICCDHVPIPNARRA